MQAEQRRPITVSVVSHGQQAMIVPLLDQLQRFCGAHIHKVVLTVNVPEPDLVDATMHAFPVHRIVNPEPRGFGSNHNAAFQHAETDWFLVLNPDIRIGHDVLGALLGLVRPETEVIAPQIVEPGASAPEPHRALLTPWEIMARRRPNYPAPVQPSWVPGMFMLLRATAYREIGGFDPRFFMYGEDFDLCARLQLAGWTITVGESLHVVHEAQRASHRNRQHLAWHFSSLLKVWASRTFWRYALGMSRPK